MPHVLRDYALLADGERGVLVGPGGDYAWMCFPRWDSDACFAALIGGGGGYAVTPTEPYVWGGFYERGLIWRSRWITQEGEIECREALAFPGHAGRAVLLRQIVARSGPARLSIVLDPRAEYGAAPARRWRHGEDGLWRAQLGSGRLIWSGAADAEPLDDSDRGRALAMVLELQPGATHDLVLVIDASSDPEPPPEPGVAWSATEAAWSDRIPDLWTPIARRDARHAYSVLQGLTSAGGGMVAAATMSLPERAQAGRNYDYRYVWIRDQCLAGQAVARAGPHPLMDEAVRFVTGRLLADGAQLAPAYTTTGGRVPDERSLDLPGYPGGFDIVGNWVNQQFQLDAFGECLLLLAAADAHDHLDADAWRAAEIAVGAIEERWGEADAGIWELDPDHWTHSRLICAAGLRAIAARQPAQQAAGWLALADAITAETARSAVHPDGRWQRSPSDSRVDASLLQIALRGGVPVNDPRSLATLRSIESELVDDGYCYRYRADARPLGEAEGAFLLCGFLLALVWAQLGNHARAMHFFERNRAACGPSGLLCEEYDVTQRQLRGNLPQAFVHAALLEAAVAIDLDHAAAGDQRPGPPADRPA